MNRIIVILALLFLLPLAALFVESAPLAGDDPLLDIAGAQMTSVSSFDQSPCRCKAKPGVNCIDSVSVGLPSFANSFDATGKSGFSSLREIAIVGSSQPVPLPPPKV